MTKNANTAVAELSLKENHNIGWKDVRILAVNAMDHRRCLLESWYIKVLGYQMNKDEGTLPGEYNGFVKI